MISLTAPTALAFALLALPIIGFYILKVRMRRIPVSTNLFWKQIYEEKPPRSIWQNFRHLISLLVQLLLLTLLVFAIADPFFAWQRNAGRRIVLIVDHSASMQVMSNVQTRLQEAITAANKKLDGVRENDQVAILVADQTPKVAVGMTSHVPTLRRALADIAKSDTSTYIQPSLDLAKQLMGDHPHGEIVVYTDAIPADPAKQFVPPEATQNSALPSTQAAATSVSEPKPEATDKKESAIDWQILGKSADNVGIVQFQARRSLTDSIGYEILINVLNASDKPVKCRLEISLDDVPVDILPIKMQPGERWTTSLEKTSLEGGTLVGRLTNIALQANDTNTNNAKSDPTETSLNGLLLDDTATAILPKRSIQKVLIVSPGNLFLRKAFEANPLVELTVVKDLPQTWPASHLIVLHRLVPTQLPPGNVFVVDPASDCDAWKIETSIDNPIITSQDDASPLMRHIQLDNVIVPKANKLTFTTLPHALASSVNNEIIFAELKEASSTSKRLVLPVDLDSSDLAFRTSFPIMVSNILKWCSSDRDDLLPAQNTGSLLSLDLTQQWPDLQAHKNLSITSPSKESQAVLPVKNTNDDGSLRNVLATIGPFDEAGVWEVAADNGAQDKPEKVSVQSIAVNLSNAQESDTRQVATTDASPAVAAFVSSYFSRPLWFYLAFLACLLLGLEWFMYQRRVIS